MPSIQKIKREYYARKILNYLFVGGVLIVLGAAPSVSMSAIKRVFQKQKVSKKQAADMFSYLKRKNLVVLERAGHDISIRLTAEGKKQAQKYQIDDLQIPVPKKWDKVWRIVIFDIPNTSTTIRNIFRRKLKEFGFYKLQKSIWISPLPCIEEVAFLREFFGVSKKQIQVLEVSKMEDDRFLRAIFKL
jgi:DNA-binding transcriptional regulator PaaX